MKNASSAGSASVQYINDEEPSSVWQIVLNVGTQIWNDEKKNLIHLLASNLHL